MSLYIHRLLLNITLNGIHSLRLVIILNMQNEPPALLIDIPKVIMAAYLATAFVRSKTDFDLYLITVLVKKYHEYLIFILISHEIEGITNCTSNLRVEFLTSD